MLVAGCGSSGSPAYQTYVGFVSATINGDCPGMYARVENSAVEYVDDLCKPRTTVMMGKTVDLGSPASIIAQIRPTATPLAQPIKLERTIESETASADGRQVKLVVTEKSYERRGNLLEPTWLRRHKVTVRGTGTAWKVTRFSEEILAKY
jgi:hypothetical protein